MPIELNIEQITLIFTVLNTTVIATLFVYLRFNIEKRLKKYEYKLGDVGELNTKMHDRLVEAEECIKYLKHIPKDIVKRLEMNASRLEKHDSSISGDVKKLLKTWNEAFFSDDEDAVVLDLYESKKTESLELIKKIKKKVDGLVK
jgi:predicted nuclease with TOPRIM domain